MTHYCPTCDSTHNIWYHIEESLDKKENKWYCGRCGYIYKENKMNTVEILQKLKETLTHQMNTGLAVQFSDQDLCALSEALLHLPDIYSTRKLLWETFGGCAKYQDCGEMRCN